MEHEGRSERASPFGVLGVGEWGVKSRGFVGRSKGIQAV